jgi:hypothetical protein
MSKSTLQHFVSNKNDTQNKAITREKIKNGSDSSQFLKRINLPEDQQPCFKILDMRGKAPGPYRKVEHNNKTMYLDDISFMIFQQGLKENNQVFTFATYNHILYGKHSYMGKESLKNTHGLNLLVNTEKRESIQDENGGEYIEGRYSPTILPLGYSSKRKEQRLIYVMPITLKYKDKAYEVKSKDFSINGLKIFLPRTLFISGEVVLLNFDFFIEKQSELTDSSATRYFKNISYKIINVQHINDKTYLSLIQLDLNDYCKETFSKFILANKVQYKFDAIDALLDAKARYTESLYTHNLTSIPLLLSQIVKEDQVNNSASNSNLSQKSYSVSSIVETSNNKKLLDFFLIPNSSKLDYDFSPFRLAHRTLQFLELSFDNSSTLLFTYWEKNKLYSLFDFEFTKQSDLAAIVLKVMAQKGKVFCLNSKKIKKPDAKRLNLIVHNLLDLERDLAKNILQQSSLIVAQLMLMDITEVFRSKSFFTKYLVTENVSVKADPSETTPADVKVKKIITTPIWCKNKKLFISGYKLINQVTLVANDPKTVILDVQKPRFKARYLYRVEISLKLKDEIIKAETIDFSEKGIGVKLMGDKKTLIASGMDIYVSFISFEKKISGLNFIDIHYKVARAISNHKTIELGLIMVKEQKNIPLVNFFSQLINRNKLKLDICINDKLDYTQSHLIEAYLDTNINSLPLLMTRDRSNLFAKSRSIRT